MKKEDKSAIIEQLQATLGEYAHFYLTDIGGLNASLTSDLRRLCYKQDIKLVVVKNKLLRKALENSSIECSELFGSLKGETALMLSNAGNAPAKLIKEFVAKTKNKDGKPLLKAAFVEETAFIGANQLDVLASLKSKNELIGELISLLQSPAKNVVSALQSGGNTIHGVLKTLGERE